MDQRSRPPREQPPPPAPAPARTRTAPSQTQPGPSTTQTRPDAPVAPRPSGPAASAGQTGANEPFPEQLTIVPTPQAGNDPTIGVDWEPARIGTNRSFGCIVTSADDHDLNVTVEQSSYRRSLQNKGIVRVPTVPVAPSGTQGTLTVRDVVTGGTATFTWQWMPRSAAGAPADVRPKAGLLQRLFGRVAPVPADAKARAQSKKTLTLEQRLGARASLAVPLKFFGQETAGQRFAFVLDRSGSMCGDRWQACTRELINTLRSLPEHCQFFLVLFSEGEVEPPGQTGWSPADLQHVEAAVSWVQKVRPGGGTMPAGAFRRVFSLPEAPDVVYFLTDGELFGFSPPACAELRGSSTAIVNTIALDNDAAAQDLETIAAESGGQYIRVSSQDAPGA